MFDGLNWLRLAFRQQGSISIEETAFDDMKTNHPDFELCAEAWTANLSFLYRLQVSLQRYASTRDFGELAEEFPPAVRAARIAELRGRGNFIKVRSKFMGGSSGGGYSGRRHRTVQQGLSDADTNRCLRELLREYNEQEREAINRHLDVLRDSPGAYG